MSTIIYLAPSEASSHSTHSKQVETKQKSEPKGSKICFSRPNYKWASAMTAGQVLLHITAISCFVSVLWWKKCVSPPIALLRWKPCWFGSLNIIYIHLYDIYIYMYIYVYSPLWNWHEMDFSSYIAWWSETTCSTSTGLTTAVRNQDFPICLLLKIYSTSSISKITSGWWYTYPSKKYEFVSWDDEIPNIWKNKKNHVPNQQPGLIKSPPKNTAIKSSIHSWFSH